MEIVTLHKSRDYNSDNTSHKEPLSTLKELSNNLKIYHEIYHKIIFSMQEK